MIPDISMIMELPNHIQLWMNITRILELVLSVINRSGSTIISLLSNRELIAPYLPSPNRTRNSADTDAAVMMFGIYMITLKNPYPGILSLASVNQTASSKDRMIWGTKLPSQMIMVFWK